MPKFRVAVLGLAAAGVLAGGGVALASSASPHLTTAETLRLYEHDTNQKFVDNDNNHKPSTGDMFVFAGNLFNKKGGKKLGTLEGQCVITFAQHVTCDATVTLNGRGEIVVAGAPNFQESDSDVAVTGGTGDFQNARGEVHIHSINDTDSIDTAHLIP